MSEASEELLPDSAMLDELLSARGPPTLRKPEFEEVGTGSKIPKLDSPTKRYPPFSVGMVYEHNDEELPEPDLEPGELWEDSDYGSDQEEDIFGRRGLRTSQSLRPGTSRSGSQSNGDRD